LIIKGKVMIFLVGNPDFPINNDTKIIMDLVTKPEKNGKAEIAKPPIKVKANAIGIFLYKPPSSENLLLPVI